MNLKEYNSYLLYDITNAIFRAHNALDAFKSWKLPARFLDVGCGSGELLRLARTNGVAEVAGVDGVQDALNQCQDISNNLHQVDLNFSGLPFEDGCFDAVACLEVLEHLYAPQNTLKEISRVTQPGGRILLSVPNPFSYSTRLRVLLGGNVSNPSIIGGHIKFFRTADITAMCESCGLQTIKIWGLAYPTAYKKYGVLADLLVKLWPNLFASWLFVFCQKPLI